MREESGVGTFHAFVTGVDQNGQHGPFAYAHCNEQNVDITFMLSADVWQGNSIPEIGDEVILWDLKKRHAGWRALGARFLTLEED